MWITGKRLRTGQTQLEGHIEAWGRTEAAEVVDRHAARTQQVEDAAETALADFPDFSHTAGLLAEADQRGDKGDEKRLVARIVWDVEENGLGVRRRGAQRLDGIIRDAA